MNTFCTLFDSHYLVKGLAMIRSIQSFDPGTRLIVYCFDALSYKILTDLQLTNVDLITLEDFETPALLQVKPTRSVAEYCWTCTPHIITDALHRFHLDEVTYLDADLFFYADPQILMNEFHSAQASVLLTEHRFTPLHDRSLRDGKYCVQFMTFKNDPLGWKALSWWGDRCLEWCYARPEDGKMGDQKYLDDWTSRFEGVHVLEHLGGGVAPWNCQQYVTTPGPRVNGHELVFYHFHRLRWYADHSIELCDGPFKLSDATIDYIYRPYLYALKEAVEIVREKFPDYSRQLNTKPQLRSKLRNKASSFLRGKWRTDVLPLQ